MYANHSKLDFGLIRKDFPILNSMNRGKCLVYLDSAASSQKPQQVIRAIEQFYAHDYANTHRGIYELSARATTLYEDGRKKVAEFIHASDSQEIIFTSGTTQAINLIAYSMAKSGWLTNGEVLISELEHHSNIVPWYELKNQFGFDVKVIPIHDDGSINLADFEKLLTAKTKLLAISHVSNALGTIVPIQEMIRLAHQLDIPVLVDGAQAIPHMPVDVTALDCDFYAFSAHKLYGPTGIGVLYGKKTWLDRLPPYQYGGNMIESVSFNEIKFAKSPQKFEAGTSHIAGVIGLTSAINYISQFGMQAIYEHEQALLKYAEQRLTEITELQIYGTSKPKVGVISFGFNNIHPHDVGTVLDHAGVAVRAGHHCAMPLMHRLNLPATVRASFGIYTNESDIDRFVLGLKDVKRLFK